MPSKISKNEGKRHGDHLDHSLKTRIPSRPRKRAERIALTTCSTINPVGRSLFPFLSPFPTTGLGQLINARLDRLIQGVNELESDPMYPTKDREQEREREREREKETGQAKYKHLLLQPVALEIN